MLKFFLYLILLFINFATIESKTRVIGGAVARAGQFPFIAAISVTTATGSHFCGGTLINNDWVVTAGQCVNGAVLFTITLGTNSLSSNDSTAVKLATENFFLHPDFNPETLENDIGLIKFRSYIVLTDYIRPAYLRTSTPIPVSSIVVTMGWGQTSDDTAGPVDNLNYVYMTTISNDECKITYGSQIVDTMVCIAGNLNQGTCLGDSGNPLIQATASGNPYLVGVSSFFSGNGCETPDPSGFTRVHIYVDWIQNITTNN